MKRNAWNTVTPFSKFIALVLFVALPFVGLYYGIQLGKVLALIQTAPGTTGTSTGGTDYYANVAAWQTDQRSDAGFAIKYPIDFEVNDIMSITPTADWRVNSDNVPGVKYFTLSIPRAFEPQTNFVDATLTVGASRVSQAVGACLTPDPGDGPATATSTATINGVPFTVFHSASAGAGNYYETTSYRTLHGSQCYAVEYTIHSSQIANYPASYGLQPLDETKLTDVLDRIVGTFTFL